MFFSIIRKLMDFFFGRIFELNIDDIKNINKKEN